MKNKVIYIILLLAFLGVFPDLNAQDIRVAETLTIHPWIAQPVMESNDLLGGIHEVANISERDNIPAERKQEGMLCTVVNDGSGKAKTYQLVNSNWVEFISVGNSSTVSHNDRDMEYWNGTAWVNVRVGQAGQYLKLSNSNIPTWCDLNITPP